MAAGNELFYHTRFMLLLCGIWRLEIKNAPAYCRNVYPIYSVIIQTCNSLTPILLGANLPTLFCTNITAGIVDSYKIYRLEKYSNSTLNKPLPLHFWYPFDEDKFYIWALVHQLAQILLTALYTAAFQTFSSSLLIFLRSQLKILQENFRNFHKFGGTQSWQNNPFRSLRMVCLKHQEFIVYVNDLNQWIKPLILMEYGTSSVMFAGAVIQVMAGVNVAFNGLFVFVLCGQLILLAWNCNEILIESGHLANALYESTWYEQDVKTKVLIHFMILRCQRSLGLTIGSFGPMTINAALSRLKLAYSYTSLMTGDENR
ncbi:odorant receptor 30a-like isoform X4 [Cylas formicarius]|uniref:odorant receptor 30a-like isoform X4 n=1 Tax=Cylas formicarius TaxID=197179 RepID=UPI0029589122|nr:odorant receptor 30a-like isoform X4 [Cylas formicarius]